MCNWSHVSMLQLQGVVFKSTTAWEINRRSILVSTSLVRKSIKNNITISRNRHEVEFKCLILYSLLCKMTQLWEFVENVVETKLEAEKDIRSGWWYGSLDDSTWRWRWWEWNVFWQRQSCDVQTKREMHESQLLMTWRTRRKSKISI